jgi:hypothetical protein
MDAVMPFTIGCRTRMGVVRGQYLSVTSRLRRRPSEFPTKLTPHPAERYTPSSKTFHFQTRSVTRHALAGVLQRTVARGARSIFYFFTASTCSSACGFMSVGNATEICVVGVATPASEI